MVERSDGFFRSSLSVCKSRVESGVQCVANGAENSTSTVAKNQFTLIVKAESSDKNIVDFS